MYCNTAYLRTIPSLFSCIATEKSYWCLVNTLLSHCSCIIKGVLSGLRRFLATESPLKMMKNAFYFTSKALFVLKIFKFLSWAFCHVSKRLNQQDKVNFKFYDVLINNCNTGIAQYLEKCRQSDSWIWSVNRM